MVIQHIKQISITDYLQQQGYVPARVQGIHYWYYSPLRNESTPSFKVNTERNQWYDFGSGEHGDIKNFLLAVKEKSPSANWKSYLRNRSSIPICSAISQHVLFLFP